MDEHTKRSGTEDPFDAGTPQAVLLETLLAVPQAEGHTPSPLDVEDHGSRMDELIEVIRNLPEEAYVNPKFAEELAQGILQSTKTVIASSLDSDSTKSLKTYLAQIDQVEDKESLRKLEILLDRTLDLSNEAHGLALDPFLARLFEPNARNDQGLQNLMTFLRRTRRTQALSRCVELGEDEIAFGFPQHFSLFLDSLDTSKGSMKKLSSICYRLTRERIDKSKDQLATGDSILEPSRIRKLLALESREVLPFASLITQIGESWVTSKVALFMRKLDLLEAESAAGRVLEDSQVPKQYLLDLCDCAIAGTEDKTLRGCSQGLITQFIDSVGDSAKHHDRRLFAIRSLRFFQDEDTYHYLQDLASSGKLFKRSKQAKAVRDAADQTLNQLSTRH